MARGWATIRVRVRASIPTRIVECSPGLRALFILDSSDLWAHSPYSEMPRLTNRDYLNNRRLLCEQWLEHQGGAFINLPRQAQLDLHDYYAPSREMWDDDAITHRDAMAKAFPSLPQKAGRAFEALRASLDGEPNQVLERYRERTTNVIESGKKQRRIRITAIANPNPDFTFLKGHLVDMIKAELDEFDSAAPATRKKMSTAMERRAEKAKRRPEN